LPLATGCVDSKRMLSKPAVSCTSEFQIHHVQSQIDLSTLPPPREWYNYKCNPVPCGPNQLNVGEYPLSIVRLTVAAKIDAMCSSGHFKYTKQGEVYTFEFLSEKCSVKSVYQSCYTKALEAGARVALSFDWKKIYNLKDTRQVHSKIRTIEKLLQGGINWADIVVVGLCERQKAPKDPFDRAWDSVVFLPGEEDMYPTLVDKKVMTFFDYMTTMNQLTKSKAHSVGVLGKRTRGTGNKNAKKRRTAPQETTNAPVVVPTIPIPTPQEVVVNSFVNTIEPLVTDAQFTTLGYPEEPVLSITQTVPQADNCYQTATVASIATPPSSTDVSRASSPMTDCDTDVEPTAHSDPRPLTEILPSVEIAQGFGDASVVAEPFAFEHQFSNQFCTGYDPDTTFDLLEGLPSLFN